MIDAILSALTPQARNRAENAVSQVSGLLRDDKTLGTWIGQSLSAAKDNGLSRAQLRSAMRTARRGARGTARRTSAYAAAHPRGVALGLGAAAVAAVGLYAVARMQETRQEDGSAPTNSTTE